MNASHVVAHVLFDRRRKGAVPLTAFLPLQLEPATELQVGETTFEDLAALLERFTLDIMRPVFLRLFRQNGRLAVLGVPVGLRFIRCRAKHLTDQIFRRFIEVVQRRRAASLAGEKRTEFYE